VNLTAYAARPRGNSFRLGTTYDLREGSLYTELSTVDRVLERADGYIQAAYASQGGAASTRPPPLSAHDVMEIGWGHGRSRGGVVDTAQAHQRP